jgi:hypothetical protein
MILEDNQAHDRVFQEGKENSSRHQPVKLIFRVEEATNHRSCISDA